jgi:DNA polymerase I
MTVLLSEAEARHLLEGVCAEYQIEVLIDPVSYKIQSPCSVDVEHNESGGMVGVGVYDGKQSLYFTKVSSSLVFSLLGCGLVAHNGKTDFECLRQWGIPVSDAQLIWDSEILAHIIDSSRRGYGLKKLAKEDLNLEWPSYDDLVGKRTAKCRRTLDQWPIDIVAMYNALDCVATYRLYEKQKPKNERCWDYFNDLEKPVSYCFAAMENRGIRIDVPYLVHLKTELETQQTPIKEAILNELGNINLNSPKQLLEALHEKQIFPTLKNRPSTDKRALSSLRDTPIIRALLSFSEFETLLSSFVNPYLERNTEIVHPFFNQCGTRTGRPSCSNPNLLQIPRRTENGRKVRRMFIARPGMLLGDCDYGQIEPRVLAHLSKDPALLQLFTDGVDFHQFTAERLGISRDKAKILNLSVGYRATFKSVQTQLGGTQDEAQSHIDKWWALFPTLRRWQETLIYDSRKSGFCTTFLGRRIRIDGLTDGNSWKREAAERQLINNITQGSAAEIMKMAMISIHTDTWITPRFGLLVQVYDELLFESDIIESDLETVKNCMINAVKLDVPLTVDSGIGANWGDCKP